eukprot:3514108-Rhodomonas_salina.2
MQRLRSVQPAPIARSARRPSALSKLSVEAHNQVKDEKERVEGRVLGSRVCCITVTERVVRGLAWLGLFSGSTP